MANKETAVTREQMAFIKHLVKLDSSNVVTGDSFLNAADGLRVLLTLGDKIASGEWQLVPVSEAEKIWKYDELSDVSPWSMLEND